MTTLHDAPDVHPVTERVYRELGSGVTAGDADAGWPLLRALDAELAALALVEDAVRGADGWARLLDPDDTPEWALRWLAVFAGVRLPRGLTTQQQRDRIREAPGQQRGTVAALRAAAREHLDGDRLVLLREREQPDGTEHPYHLTVATFAGETPDPDAVAAAISAATPAGIVTHHVVESGWTWGDALDEHATWDDVVSSYATWDEFIAVIPPQE